MARLTMPHSSVDRPIKSASSKSFEHYQVDCSSGREILDLRAQGFDAIPLLGRYHYREARQELAPHTHGNMVEICFLESGRQIYKVNEEEHPLAGGDVFVSFPNEYHGTGAHPESRGVLYWALISVQHGTKSFLSLPPAESKVVMQALLNMPRRSFHACRTLQPTLHSIFAASAASRDPLRKVNLRNLLLRFVLDIVGSAGQPHTPKYSRHIQAALDRIDSDIETVSTLGSLAEHVGLSLPRLKSKFKGEVGVPPADYIMRRRVEKAVRLLRESDQSVIDIAMQLGFSSSQYFATVFKRYTRHSPHEARTANLQL